MDADILIRAARAVDAASMAGEMAYAAEEAHSTPGNAAQLAWDASSLLRSVGEQFIALSDAHKFAAKKFERAQVEEDRTGVEYKGPSAA